VISKVAIEKLKMDRETKNPKGSDGVVNSPMGLWRVEDWL
jgi:hypothetical protein